MYRHTFNERDAVNRREPDWDPFDNRCSCHRIITVGQEVLQCVRCECFHLHDCYLVPEDDEPNSSEYWYNICLKCEEDIELPGRLAFEAELTATNTTRSSPEGEEDWLIYQPLVEQPSTQSNPAEQQSGEQPQEREENSNANNGSNTHDVEETKTTN